MPHITDHLWTLEDTPVHCSATIIPYVPARGPTYACGGEPPEGGYAEDLCVWLERTARDTNGNPYIETLDITDYIGEKEAQAILDDIYGVWEADRAAAEEHAADLAFDAAREDRIFGRRV